MQNSLAFTASSPQTALERGPRRAVNPRYSCRSGVRSWEQLWLVVVLWGFVTSSCCSAAPLPLPAPTLFLTPVSFSPVPGPAGAAGAPGPGWTELLSALPLLRSYATSLTYFKY